MTAGIDDFANALRKESHTLKRALTDPHLFSGIGNAYSDEILHRAKLSPFKLTRPARRLTRSQRCHAATRETLAEWTAGFRRKPRESSPRRSRRFTTGWPSTAGLGSRARAAGRRCSGSCTASTRSNYCPTCQTEGRLLADRALLEAAEGRLAEDARRARAAPREARDTLGRMDIPKTEDQWRAALTPEQFQVLRSTAPSGPDQPAKQGTPRQACSSARAAVSRSSSPTANSKAEPAGRASSRLSKTPSRLRPIENSGWRDRSALLPSAKGISAMFSRTAHRRPDFATA